MYACCPVRPIVWHSERSGRTTYPLRCCTDKPHVSAVRDWRDIVINATLKIIKQIIERMISTASEVFSLLGGVGIGRHWLVCVWYVSGITFRAFKV
jgi:hypothetical protein